MQILIIFLSGLGNMLLFIPTLQSIRESYPDAKITMWLKQAVAVEVAKSFNLVDEFITYHSKVNLVKQLAILSRLQKNNYDFLITTFIEQGLKVRLQAHYLKAKRKIGYKVGCFTDRWFTDLLDLDHSECEADRHFRIAKLLDSSANKMPPCWDLSAEQAFVKDVISSRRIDKDRLLVGMHPGCSMSLSYKRWPAKNFAKLADIIYEKYNAQIIIFGGEEETPLSRQISDYAEKCRPILLTGKTNINQTAAMIKECDYFISNDSGLMHIASVINTPQIALFGGTSVIKNTPQSTKVIVVDGKKIKGGKKNSIENIELKHVLNEFEKLKKWYSRIR